MAKCHCSGMTEFGKQIEENVWKVPNTFRVGNMYSGSGSFYSLLIHPAPLPTQVTPTPAAFTAPLTTTFNGPFPSSPKTYPHRTRTGMGGSWWSSQASSKDLLSVWLFVVSQNVLLTPRCAVTALLCF